MRLPRSLHRRRSKPGCTGKKFTLQRKAEHRTASLVAGIAARRGFAERPGPRFARLAKEGES